MNQLELHGGSLFFTCVPFDRKGHANAVHHEGTQIAGKRAFACVQVEQVLVAFLALSEVDGAWNRKVESYHARTCPSPASVLGHR